MKVIDLLVKIANGKEVPEKIRYCSDLYEIDYRYMDYKNKYINDTYLLRDVISSSEELCNKIEVVEEVLEDTPKEEIQVLSRWYPPKEDKKIKRIQSCGDNLYSEYIGEWLVHKENYSEYDELLMNKINEIIEKINGE